MIYLKNKKTMRKCKIITTNLTSDTLEKQINDFFKLNPKIEIEHLIKEANSLTIIYNDKK